MFTQGCHTIYLGLNLKSKDRKLNLRLTVHNFVDNKFIIKKMYQTKALPLNKINLITITMLVCTGK